jgi:hypothetical protein
MSEKSLTFNIFGRDVTGSAAIQEFSAKSGEHIAGFTKKVVGLGLAFIGISSVIGFGKKAVEAATATENANVKLNQALSNTHSGFKANSQAVDDVKSKLAGYGFTGAQVSDALAKMTTGLGNGNKALNTMQVAADLARYKNIDLSEAALIVTKGMEGQLKPLRALGIDLPVYAGNAQQVAVAQKNLADKQAVLNDLLAKHPDAAAASSKAHAAYETAVKNVTAAQAMLNAKTSTGDVILATLSGRLSGQAAKSTETYAGQVAVMNAQFDEMYVKIGTLIIPGLTWLAKTAGDFASAMSNGQFWDDWLSGMKSMVSGSQNLWAQWIAFQFVNQQRSEAGFALHWTQMLAHSHMGLDLIGTASAQGWAAIGVGFGNGWSVITGTFARGWDGMVAATGRGFSQITGWFIGGAAQIVGTVNAMWNNLISAFAVGWARIQAFLSGHPLTATGTIKYLSTAPNGPAPGMMASGGIVRARPGGTAKIIGEGGNDEAVVPLTAGGYAELAKGIAAAGGGGGRGDTYITINEVTDAVGTANAVFLRLWGRSLA